MLFQIYKITNKLNGKLYFGLTKGTAQKRWTKHVNTARNGNNSAFSAAIRKYGPDSFFVEHIFTAFNAAYAAEVERQLIAENKSIAGTQYGYNISGGGQLGMASVNASRGSDHYKTKMTEDHVRRSRENTEKSDAELALIFSQELGSAVSMTAVYFARTGRSWKSLNDKYPPVTYVRERRGSLKRGQKRIYSPCQVWRIYYGSESINSLTKSIGGSHTAIKRVRLGLADQYEDFLR